MRLALFGLAAVLLAYGSVNAQPEPHFQRLVGRGDILWSTPGLRVLYALSPHLAGPYALFYARASDASGQQVVSGVWLWDGHSFERVIDTTMPEGQSGVLDRLYGVDETGLVGVTVEGAAVYGWRDGDLFTIAQYGAAPPGAPAGATFSSLSYPVVRNGTISFVAALAGVPSEESFQLYSWTEGSGLNHIPLGGLQGPSDPAVSSDGMFLTAWDPSDPDYGGILWHRDAAGAFTPYFRFDTPYPGVPPGSVWLGSIQQLGVLPDGVAIKLVNDTFSVAGIFRVSPTAIEPVLLEGQPDPGSGAPVEAIWPEYSADGDRIAFRTLHPASLFGITLVVQEADRSLDSLLTVGDILDGREVTYLETTHGALSGDLVGIEVWNTNETGIWIANLAGAPAPSALEIPSLDTIGLLVFAALLGVGGVFLTRRRQPHVRRFPSV